MFWIIGLVSVCTHIYKCMHTVKTEIYTYMITIFLYNHCPYRKRNVCHQCKRISDVKNIEPANTNESQNAYDDVGENPYYQELGELAETSRYDALN